MCGINGITESNQELVARMNAVTRSRGPDGTHVRVFSHCTLGHNRLSIIDTSDNASQPMTTPDGRYTIVFNGEIYNFQELRKELEGKYVFNSKGDTEVLLAGWSVWGSGILSRLRGIFAFAIWDGKEQTLTAVRDQLGVKPFYYAVQSGKLLFSSELKGVLEGMRERRLNQAALALYLGIQYVPSPDTLVQGVKKLLPGHLLTYKDGALTVDRYYRPETLSEIGSTDLYTTIDAAVQRQLISDRPVGVFLSGGLDSSIVLHHVAARVSSPATFSVAFEMVKGFEQEAEKFNADAQIAKTTSAHYGTKHTRFELSLTDIRRVICEELDVLDEPIANPTAISQYLLSKLVRDDIVVALSGDGGDELFVGYPRHRFLRAAALFQRLPKRLQQLMGLVHRHGKKLSVPFGVSMHRALMAQSESVLKDVYRGTQSFSHIFAESFDLRYEYYRDFAPVDQYMQVDRSTWLPDESLLKLDKVSMAHGLEVRVPLLDLDIVALADRYTVEEKCSLWTGKKILRDLYKTHLPAHLFTEPKRGWISPGAKWLRDEQIAVFARNVFSKAYYDGLAPILDFGAVQRMLDNHIAMREYRLLPLWNILLLQVWARTHQVTL